MRASCVVTLLVLFVCALPVGSRAQDAIPRSTRANTDETRDIAEQLVAQFEQWYENLAGRGQVPRGFTGVTRDARQLVIVLDGFPFDHAKRRDFLIWLNQKYSFVAYAYATRVMMEKAPGQELVEALDIIASSFDKDVFLTLLINRQQEGSIKYVRDSYRSDDAAQRKDVIFSGLHRSFHALTLANSEEFEKVWATWEGRAHWRRLNTETNEQRVDDANALLIHALQLYQSGDCYAALPLSQKAADLLRAQGGVPSANFADALVAQGLCYKRLARFTEAERVYRQAIEIYETVQGLNSRELAIALDNLASLYSEHGRISEAEQLRIRALQIFRATLDPASPHIATALQNLALLYAMQGQLSKAQESFMQALAVNEKAFGVDSRQVGVVADNLAGVYRDLGQLDQAEAFYLRAISIFEKVVGHDHPDTALALQNYAILLKGTGRPDEAEANVRKALGINERHYGANHNTVAAALNTLVLKYIAEQRWRDALDASRRSAAISAHLAARGKASASSEGRQGTSAFRRLVQVAYNFQSTDPALIDEGYMAAQRALSTEASLALSQLAARHASGDGALASLVRERQDLIQELESQDKLLIAAVAKAPNQRDRTGEVTLRSHIGKIGSRIDEIELELSKRFPDYAALSMPAPISIADTQALLNPDEVLLQYLDLQAVDTIPETGFAWLITKTDAQWIHLPVGKYGLARSIATLRCGLDATRWLEAGGKHCSDLLKLDAPPSAASLPFNLMIAYELYQTLLAPFEEKIKGKHLLIIPSGALATLPLSVLVTENPIDSVPRIVDGYRGAAWLGARQPITVLPSVGSLKALRQFAKISRATKRYLGIGNPLLEGQQSHSQFGAYYRKQAELARGRQKCPKVQTKPITSAAAQSVAGFDKLFRGTTADIDAVREWSPLPETADELCEVGRRLGVPEREIMLGMHATEAALKEMSDQGRLADYGILHFATHGALAGYVKGSAEPGLILTPPPKGTTDPNALERDDGFLTASEIAMLRLDANWVILSACNTAGSSGETAEAFSGMARAFFYAGARALLVSHWEVNSDVAVKLTTRAFAELKSKPRIGRAEAFRISMRNLLERGTPSESHPSQWAPFVIVGEGGTAVQATSVITSPKAPPSNTSAAERKAQRAKLPPASDWRTEIWRQ